MKVLLISFALITFISTLRIDKPDWKKLFLHAIMGYHYVSSELDEVNPFEELGKYGAHNLLDDTLSTAWVEGVEGSGIGEYLYLGIGSDYLKKHWC